MGKADRVVVSQDSEAGVSLFVKHPSKIYLEEFLRDKCSPDLLERKFFPNIKELTESYTAFAAVRRMFGVQAFGNPDIVLIDVGCGATPRTAALFAFKTRWKCHAVDPRLHVREYRTDRLHLCPTKIEDMVFNYPDKTVVVVAVHAHIVLDHLLDVVRAKELAVVAMPCCKPLNFTGLMAVTRYEDWGCWSPRREVIIYRPTPSEVEGAKRILEEEKEHATEVAGLDKSGA
jgi:hypothetical protein